MTTDGLRARQAPTLTQIKDAFSDAGMAGLPDRAYDQFLVYLDVLLRWNAQVNLTSVRDPDQIIRRHFVECAFAAQHLPADTDSLLDYGSGAGFPGIPFAICRPEISVTLAESHGRKASFLREAIRELEIGAQVYDGRVDTLPAGRLFNAVSMRAVEKMQVAIPVAEKRAQKYLILFTTEESAPTLLRLAPRFEWFNPVPLPNSTQMILSVGQRAMFHVEP